MRPGFVSTQFFYTRQSHVMSGGVWKETRRNFPWQKEIYILLKLAAVWPCACLHKNKLLLTLENYKRLALSPGQSCIFWEEKKNTSKPCLAYAYTVTVTLSTIMVVGQVDHRNIQRMFRSALDGVWIANDTVQTQLNFHHQCVSFLKKKKLTFFCFWKKVR